MTPSPSSLLSSPVHQKGRPVLQPTTTTASTTNIVSSSPAKTKMSTDNNNISNNNKQKVKQPKTVVMMRTPSQDTLDGGSQFMFTTSINSDSSAMMELARQQQETEDEALAAVAARAGESVYDSPTSRSTGKRLTTISNKSPIGRLESFDSQGSQDYSQDSSYYNDDDDEEPSGIIASGLAWMRRSRASTRRKNLQKEAERQIQKIKEAEIARRMQPQEPNEESLGFNNTTTAATATTNHDGNNDGASSSSATAKPSDNQKNPTFLQMRNFNGSSITPSSKTKAKTNNNRKDLLSKDGFRVTSTESGEGASAHLDWGSLHNGEDDEDDDDDEIATTVPQVRIANEEKISSSSTTSSLSSSSSGVGGESSSPKYILTKEQMHQIAIHVLPSSVQYCRWKLTYSLNRDGDSFEGCLRKIDSVSRTLMVVRTTKGEIFGGYADSPWRHHSQHQSQFYGSAGACLFRLLPKITTTATGSTKSHTIHKRKKKNKNIVNVYHWTGKNRYIQLCDISRKMLAFGGGGHDGVFGLAVEEDFQTGSTGPCDTFDNDRLCSEEIFDIVDLEFWEFLTGMF